MEVTLTLVGTDGGDHATRAESGGSVAEDSKNGGGEMAEELIPPEMRDFIQRHIDSIAQLEALLLLLNRPGDSWTPDSVTEHLYIDRDQATQVLEQLCAGGLAGRAGDTYWFNSDPPGQREIVQRLAVVYAKHLIPVTNLVHAKPAGARAFAAAFKLRKDR